MKRCPHERLDLGWAPVQVGGRKAKESKTRVDEKVLAPVVSHQALAMVSPVELDDEAGLWVVQIGPSDEPPSLI